MAHRKRSWVELSQPPKTAPMPYRRLAQAKILQLGPPHHPVLAVSQFGDRLLHLASL